MMATSDQHLSSTLRGGSDITYDYFCEPCLEDGQDIEARGYCQQCSAYLCDECLKHHKKNPSSKQHLLLDAATMPRMVYKDVAIDTDTLVAMVTDEKSSTIRNEEDNDEYRRMTRGDIRSSRQEMDKLLDDAEKRALQRVDELHKENAEKINSASQNCKAAFSEVTTMAADLEKKSREGQGSQLFVAMKMAGRRLPAMAEELNHLKARKISHYKFNKDNIVQYFTSILSTMFCVTVTPDSADTKARHVADVNIKTADDSKECVVSGIVALSDGRFVVTDEENNAVKLADVGQNKVTSRLTLSSTPLDVTKTQPDEIAVLLGIGKKIEIFTVTDILTRTKVIDVHGTTFSSICFDRNRFVLLSSTTRSVKTVDMAGKVVSTVYTDSDNDPLFKKPKYITLNSTHDVVVITDWDANTVTCMTLRGRVIWVYKHAELNSSRGVTVGSGNDVIVCGGRSQAVQLVSRSGHLVQVLLDKQRGLAPFPQAISINEDTLCVSSNSTKPEHRNYVSVFQLE